MTAHRSPPDPEQVFWDIVVHRLRLAAADPPLSRRDAADLLAQLPPRQGQETLGDRLRRVGRSIPNHGFHVRFRPLTAIQRLAADSGEVAPLPDPGRPLESADGRFRLWIAAANGTIQLTLEALGFASDDFAGRRLGLAAAGPWSQGAADRGVRLLRDAVIAEWTLDEDGEGVCEIPDSLENRRALLQPVIGALEDDA